MKYLTALIACSVFSMSAVAQEAASGTSIYTTPTTQNIAPTTPTSPTMQTTQPMQNNLQNNSLQGVSRSYPATQNSYQDNNSTQSGSTYQSMPQSNQYQTPSQQYQQRTTRNNSQYNSGERLNNPNSSY
ncbi:MAG: hypothetical protein V4629_08735 [Pseudomonadota bacterium]